MLWHERGLWRSGLRFVAGIDEAGRGPLAGPVVAAAVVFRPGTYVEGVDDSKVLSPVTRDLLCDAIMKEAAVGIGVVDHQTIDEINILRATFRAMSIAVCALPVAPEHLLVDGNRFEPAGPPWGPDHPIAWSTIIGGDGTCFSIAAASIVAKVTRDRIMADYELLYPGYGFGKHKGYATREHIEAMMRLGRCPIHRRTFHVQSQLEMDLR